jgi:DNA helicase-2/ATP-dependent DNA helicase PcrA
LRNQGAPNLPHPIAIADDFDERWVIQEELRTLSGAKRITEVRDELRKLASDWESLAADADEWERDHPNPRFLGAWRAHRKVYGYTLRAELVYGVKKGLEQDPEFQLEEEFEHVVVDEYQDLNRCELAVVEELVGRGPELFAAGDDDQSIYGFRNAFPLGLREFPETYEGAAERELVICHRCDRTILDLALSVAEQDVDRIPKRLGPRPRAGEGEVRALKFDSIAAEARGIADVCRGLIDGGLQANDILILLRNDPQRVYSDPIVRALAEQGMAAELPVDPFKALEEGDARVVVLFLRLLQSRDDSLAWRELLELRENGIGRSTLLDVYRLADERGECYSETLHAILGDPDLLTSRLRNRLAEEVRAIDEILDDLNGVLDEPAEEGLNRVLQAADEGGDLDDVKAFLLTLLEEEDATLGKLEQARQSARGGYTEEERAADTDHVQIMSMHSAKGLTAAAVIVAACEDELIPGKANDKRAIDDERRLLYVSMTRARHYLHLTYVARRKGRQTEILQVSERRSFTQFLSDFLNPESV